MKILSFINQKGGCGKTTSAVNLACAFAKNNNKTLLIDLDPQAHATFSLGINPLITTTDLLENVSLSRPINPETTLKSLDNRRTNLSVLGSSIGLSAIENMLTAKKGNLETLKTILDTLSSSFDYCIIDCPPNLGLLTLNAISVSDYAIAPMGICELSLKGVENLKNIFSLLSQNKKNVPELYYLITQVDKRFRFSQDFLKKAKELLGKNLLSVTIRTNISLREAAAKGKSIYEYRSNSRGSVDYMSLAEEIEKIINPSKIKILDKHAKGIKFSLKGNGFNEVFVVGEFNNWQKTANFKLKRLDTETWSINVPLTEGKYRYKFVADNQWFKDPMNPLEEKDPFGGINSIISVDS